MQEAIPESPSPMKSYLLALCCLLLFTAPLSAEEKKRATGATLFSLGAHSGRLRPFVATPWSAGPHSTELS